MLFKIENSAALKRAMEEFSAFLIESAVSQESVFDCKLVAYELLGNVLRHAKESAELLGEIDGGFVQLTIKQSGAPFKYQKGTLPPAQSEHGRGLYLVDSVSAERIILPDGTTVVRIKIK